MDRSQGMPGEDKKAYKIKVKKTESKIPLERLQ
jgi:hypothetical protein